MKNSLIFHLAGVLALGLAACSADDTPPQDDQGDSDLTDTAAGGDGQGSDDAGIAAPVIASFTASSASIGLGGGEVTLTWNVTGATALTIDNDVGVVTGQLSAAVAITSTTTFTLTATSAGGSVSAQVTVTVATPTSAPVIHTFTATPATLLAWGGGSTLEWNVDQAQTISIDHEVGNVSGTTQVGVNVLATTTFTLTAVNALGTSTETVTVTVPIPSGPPSIVSFTADKTSLPPAGGWVHFSWNVSDAQQLVMDNSVGDVSGRTSADVRVAASTLFKLTASNLHGSAQSQIQITVQPYPQPTITSFTASPATRTGPGYVTLSWSAQNFDTLALNPGNQNVTYEFGSKDVWVTATTTFTLTARNSAGMTANSSTTVTVVD